MAIAGSDIKNGIAMLQNALWREYRDARLVPGVEHRQVASITCGNCGASWENDPLTRPEHHRSGCALTWKPEIPDRSAIEQRAKDATDFLYEQGWKKIMEDPSLSEEMFRRLFMLREVVK